MNEKLDKRLLCLLSNGDIPTWSNQLLYEQAWNEGIRPLNEDGLKPDLLTKRKRRKAGRARMDLIGTSFGRLKGSSHRSVRY